MSGLCGVCRLSLCLCGSPPGTSRLLPQSKVRLIGDAKIPKFNIRMLSLEIPLKLKISADFFCLCLTWKLRLLSYVRRWQKELREGEELLIEFPKHNVVNRIYIVIFYPRVLRQEAVLFAQMELLAAGVWLTCDWAAQTHCRVQRFSLNSGRLCKIHISCSETPPPKPGAFGCDAAAEELATLHWNVCLSRPQFVDALLCFPAQTPTQQKQQHNRGVPRAGGGACSTTQAPALLLHISHSADGHVHSGVSERWAVQSASALRHKLQDPSDWNINNNVAEILVEQVIM